MSIRYRRRAIRPWACMTEGWALVKERYWLFFGVSFVGVMLASMVPLYLIAGPMICGIHICLMNQERRQTVRFDMLFKGFDHFKPSLVATLFMAVPLLLIILSAYIAFVIAMFNILPPPGAAPGAPNPNTLINLLIMMGVYCFVVVTAGTLLPAMFMFTYPLIVDRRIGGMESVKASLGAVFKNIGGWFGLVLLQTFIVYLGTAFCFVGYFFVLPLYFASTTVAYRQVFGDDPELGEFDHHDDDERDYLEP